MLHCFLRTGAFLFLSVFIGTAVRAEQYGGIEIGSTGIKRVIIDVPAGSGVRPADTSANVALESGLEASKLKFKGAVLDEAVDVITNFVNDLTTTRKISKDNIYIAVSSGLKKAATPDGRMDAPALTQLHDAIKEATGLDIDIIDGKREAELTFFGVVPLKDQPTSIVIDVGGGNTKIAIQNANQAIQHGASSLSKARAEKGKAADAAAQTDLKNLLQSEGFKGKTVERIYLSGGPAYIASTLAMPSAIGENSRGTYTLKPTDIQEKADLLATFTEQPQLNTLFEKALTGTAGGVRDNLQNAAKIYTFEKLQAGTWMLAEAIKEVRAASPNALIFFHGDGQTAWIRGYIQKKVYERNPPAAELDKLRSEIQDELNKLKKDVRDLELRVGQRNDNGGDGRAPLPPTLSSDLQKMRQTLDSINSSIGTMSVELKTSLDNRPSRSDFESLQKALTLKLDDLTKAVLKIRPTAGDSTVSRANAAFFYAEGVSLARRQLWKRAIVQFENSLQYVSTNPNAWFYCAICQLNDGQHESARKSIEEVAYLLNESPRRYSAMCTALELIQGPTRAQAELMLLTARGGLAANP